MLQSVSYIARNQNIINKLMYAKVRIYTKEESKIASGTYIYIYMYVCLYSRPFCIYVLVHCSVSF